MKLLLLLALICIPALCVGGAVLYFAGLMFPGARILPDWLYRKGK